MTRLKPICQASLIVLATMVFAATASNAQDDERAFPETVMATFRVKPGQVDAFLKLMPEYWAALRADDMVLTEPHLLLRGVENGKPVVVEIFTWKTHDAPDHAPAEIQAYWNKLHAMVEDRDGHSGIEFPEMTIVKTRN